jgi:PPK2 family polyphosphate:nucleotide phosphotransferase
MGQPILISPGTRVRLHRFDPHDTSECDDKDKAEKLVARHVERMVELQRILFAEAKHALLIVLQAMDGGGKDGTIRHVMTGLNPLGCRVTGFRAPTPEELSHDFLWRVHREVPPRGWIGIFNRSHYEDVLAVRVRKLVPPSVWRGRYDDINAFESLLARNGVTILKFYLNISKKEQKERLEKRLSDPHSAWKFDAVDWDNRRLWKHYMAAYEDAIARCNRPWAPWHVVPADHKWYRNLVVSERIVRALEGMNLRYPRPRAARRAHAGH